MVNRKYFGFSTVIRLIFSLLYLTDILKGKSSCFEKVQKFPSVSASNGPPRRKKAEMSEIGSISHKTRQGNS